MTAYRNKSSFPSNTDRHIYIYAFSFFTKLKHIKLFSLKLSSERNTKKQTEILKLLMKLQPLTF